MNRCSSRINLIDPRAHNNVNRTLHTAGPQFNTNSRYTAFPDILRVSAWIDSQLSCSSNTNFFALSFYLQLLTTLFLLRKCSLKNHKRCWTVQTLWWACVRDFVVTVNIGRGRSTMTSFVQKPSFIRFFACWSPFSHALRISVNRATRKNRATRPRAIFLTQWSAKIAVQASFIPAIHHICWRMTANDYDKMESSAIGATERVNGGNAQTQSAQRSSV